MEHLNNIPKAKFVRKMLEFVKNFLEFVKCWELPFRITKIF